MQPNYATQHVTGRSHVDLGSAFSDVRSKGGIYISFQWDMVTLHTANPEKNGTRERRLRLMKQPVGDPQTAASSYITEEMAAEMFPAEWDYFNKNGDMPLTGTAISELPGISNSQIQIMQLSGLRSIEDILSVPEETINRIGHEGRYVRTVAQEWRKKLDASSDIMSLAEVKTGLTSQLAAANHRAQMAEAEAAAMKMRLDVLERMMGSNMVVPSAPSGTVHHDEGPDIDSTANPLAEGSGELDDDFLNND